jgi:hypothetical protein
MTKEMAGGGAQLLREFGLSGDAIRGSVGEAGNAVIGKDNVQIGQFNPTTIFQALVQPGRLSALNLESLLSLEREALWDPSVHLPETELYLSKLEDLVRRELTKSRDEHFVELSMKLAQSTAHSTPGSYLYRMAVGNSDDDQQTIRDLAGLQETLGTRSLVVLGIPGSGKSTVLQHLTLRMIGAYREGKSNRLPFFVRLTEYESLEGRPQPILEFLKSRAVALVGEKHFITRDFEDLVRVNRFVFILDGLDQMPGRRSETIRIKQLKKIEDELKRVDWLLKIARLFRQKDAVSRLLGSRQEVTTEAAPKIDPREEEISKLSDDMQCAVITSCRMHDFIGVPRWQTLSILPMDTDQINKFIRLYAPNSETDINLQMTASSSTRALITNPFYLRMLTQALREGLRDSVHASQLKRALTKRGMLLEYLIGNGIYRYVGRNEKDLTGKKEKEARVKYILGKLGMLAYYMLERNVIGSVPNDALERILGSDLRPVIDAGVDGNLITIHTGEIGSVEFNHQLFLEFLLAFDLKRRAAEEGGFEEALKLLSLRGDRWAETIRLLFEMVDEASAERLVEKFVQALRAQETWDISTRVLSDLGERVAPYIAPLLRETDEMTVTGAATILGKTNAQEFAGELVMLCGARSWRVRRSAVEALTAMRLATPIAKFENDRHPAVMRAVFRARLCLEKSPDVSIKAELNGNNRLRSEQMAFAVLDEFSSLVTRLDDEAILDLLLTLIGHKDHDIRVLGFLMTEQSSDYFRRHLKSELLTAALEDDDSFVNVIARRAVLPLLDQSDLAEIKTLVPQSELNIIDLSRQGNRVLRAYWLLLEAREMVSPSEYLDSLSYAPRSEVELLTKKLARRADSTSLSFLTFLLADKRTTLAAVAALTALKEKGVAYLLDALDDPSPEIRINVATLLQFCHLPRKYARQVRKNLRAAGIRTHDAYQAGTGDPNAGLDSMKPRIEGTRYGLVIGAFVLIIVDLVSPFAVWLGSRILASQTTYSYWIEYGLWRGGSLNTVTIGSQWWVLQVEKNAFGAVSAKRDADFWLARGRLERALGRKVPAKDSLRISLGLRPDSVATRLELALIQRSLGNVRLAQEILEADDRKYLTKDSDLEALERLLSIEEIQREDPSNYNGIERMRLLDRLGLWHEARSAALTRLRTHGYLAEAALVLFHAYKGAKQTRRALAAAVGYNDRAGERPEIRQAEIEDLQWQHRMDSFPTAEIGRFEIAMDLESDEAAMDILRALEILPESFVDISEDYIARIQKLPPEVQEEVGALLSRSGYLESPKLVVDLMPLQQREELRGGR